MALEELCVVFENPPSAEEPARFMEVENSDTGQSGPGHCPRYEIDAAKRGRYK